MSADEIKVHRTAPPPVSKKKASKGGDEPSLRPKKMIGTIRARFPDSARPEELHRKIGT